LNDRFVLPFPGVALLCEFPLLRFGFKWQTLRRRTIKGFVENGVPLADSVRANEAMVQSIPVPINVITKRSYQPCTSKLRKLFCGIHQVQEQRRVRILAGNLNPIPHPLYRSQHRLTSVFWERSKYTPRHAIAPEKSAYRTFPHTRDGSYRLTAKPEATYLTVWI
jgi:hypothetical protein